MSEHYVIELRAEVASLEFRLRLIAAQRDALAARVVRLEAAAAPVLDCLNGAQIAGRPVMCFAVDGIHHRDLRACLRHLGEETD